MSRNQGNRDLLPLHTAVELSIDGFDGQISLEYEDLLEDFDSFRECKQVVLRHSEGDHLFLRHTTLQVVLATSIDFEMGVDYGYFTALTTLTVLPVQILYGFFQKRIIQGIAMSGPKGG